MKENKESDEIFKNISCVEMEFFISYILIHLVCQFVIGLGKGVKGVLCSRKLSVVGRIVVTDFEDRARGIDELKNRSGKCEGPGGGIDELKNRNGKCEGPGEGGLDGVKNRSEKCEGPGGGGGDQQFF